MKSLSVIKMFKVIKRLEIAGSHQLHLPYESKCRKLHGHNWIVTIHCKSETLNSSGMVIDFSIIKEKVKRELDHQNLNDIFEFNPTAENIAKWICNEIPKCYKVEVQESEGNTAIYERNEG